MAPVSVVMGLELDVKEGDEAEEIDKGVEDEAKEVAEAFALKLQYGFIVALQSSVPITPTPAVSELRVAHDPVLEALWMRQSVPELVPAAL